MPTISPFLNSAGYLKADLEYPMLKRWFVILVVLLVSVSGVSAQEGGSTLQAWADSPASALNISTQVEWPEFRMQFGAVNTYGTAGDPAPSCSSGHSYSLWQTFVAPQTGKLGIWAGTNNYDTVAVVYKTTPSAANTVACLNGTTSTNAWDGGDVNVTAGTRYYVMFAAVGTGVGVNSSSVLNTLYYGNNAEIGAFQIPAGGNYTNLQDHIETAVPTLSDPVGTCPGVSHIVYYKFRPSSSGMYEFSTLNSSYDTVIGVTEGGNLVGCNDNINTGTRNSRLRLNLTAGHRYLIVIGQSNSAAPLQTDNMTLSLRVRKL